MKKLKKVESIKRNKDGIAIGFNLASTGANDDWIRSARLARKADNGDKEAKAELEELNNTPMFYSEEDEGE